VTLIEIARAVTKLRLGHYREHRSGHDQSALYKRGILISPAVFAQADVDQLLHQRLWKRLIDRKVQGTQCLVVADELFGKLVEN